MLTENSIRRGLAAAAALAASFFFAAPAFAQYPVKPIRVFLPFGPGGVGDITFRLITGTVSERSNLQFVIENRPGAGGVASAVAGKTAAPDGYTLAQIGNSYALSSSLFASLPYDLFRDFAPVSTLAQFDMLLAARPAGGFGTVAGLMDYDRAHPGKLNFGSISAGSTQNIAAQMFKAMTSSQATIVTFKSSPELILALQRGEVDVAFDYLAAFASPLAQNDIKLIASTGEQRSPLTPGTPTAAESGLPGYVVTAWNGVAAPIGTPPAIIAKLNQEITAALATPDMRERFKALGMEAVASTPEGMAARLRADMERWRDVIDKLGLRQ